VSAGSLACGVAFAAHENPNDVPGQLGTVASDMHEVIAYVMQQWFVRPFIPWTPMVHAIVAVVGLPVGIHEYPVAVPVHPVTDVSTMHGAGGV